MLSAIFVTSGIEGLRHPSPMVEKAEPQASTLAAKLGLSTDPEVLVRINAGVHIGAGALLAIGKFRRLASLALLGSLIPTTWAAHRFWEIEDESARAQQQTHFFKNLGLMGGLLLSAVDTEGAPSLGWRARRTARRAGTAVVVGTQVGKGKVKVTKGRAAAKVAKAASKAAAKAAAAKALAAQGAAVKDRATAKAAKAAAKAAAKGKKSLAGTTGTAGGKAAGRAAVRAGATAAGRAGTTAAGRAGAKAAAEAAKAAKAAAKAAGKAGKKAGKTAATAGKTAKVGAKGVAVKKVGAALLADSDGSVTERAGELLTTGARRAGDLVSAAAEHLPVG